MSSGSIIFVFQKLYFILVVKIINMKLFIVFIFFHATILIFNGFIEVCYAMLSHFSHAHMTLCDPINGSPPGSDVPGILLARTLEWVAISFSNKIECSKA